VLKNAEFWRALAPAVIIARWRASFAVIDCGLGGAMAHGLVGVLHNRKS
jgi:hypothetical protein